LIRTFSKVDFDILDLDSVANLDTTYVNHVVILAFRYCRYSNIGQSSISSISKIDYILIPDIVWLRMI